MAFHFSWRSKKEAQIRMMLNTTFNQHQASLCRTEIHETSRNPIYGMRPAHGTHCCWLSIIEPKSKTLHNPNESSPEVKIFEVDAIIEIFSWLMKLSAILEESLRILVRKR